MTEFLVAGGIVNWSLLWQTTLCLAVGGLASFAFARRPARAHSVLLLALLAAISLPLVSQCFQQMNWGVFPAEGPAPEPIVDVALSGIGPLRSASGNETALIGSEEPVQYGESSGNVGPPPVSSPGTHEVGSTAPGDETSFDWSSALILGWTTLSCILLLRLFVSLRLGYRLLSTAEQVEHAALERAVRSAAHKMGVDRVPEIRSSAEVCCPLIWAWARRPILVIPRSLTTPDSSIDWESITCHELAHWKRRDQMTSLLTWVFAALFPWHPLAWWTRRRVHELSERACDDWVLAVGRSPTGYAETLIQLVPQRRSVLALAAVSSRANLRTRLAWLLDGRKREPTAGWRWSVLLTLITSLLVCGFASAQRRTFIRTHRVDRGPISIRLSVRGVLESAEHVDIRSEVKGKSRVLALAPDVQRVRKGDLLVELDSAELKDRVSDATVQVHLAQAKLAQAKARLASVSNDGTTHSDAKKKELEAYVSAAQVALDVAQARLATAKQESKKTKLYSPVDGVFEHYQLTGRRTQMKAQEGSLVRERQIIGRVFDPTRLHARLSVPVSWVKQVNSGQAVILRIDAFPHQVVMGEVTRVEQVPDPVRWFSVGEREHAVWVALDLPAVARKPGLTVEAEFPLVDLTDALRIPLQAIERRDDRTFCLVRVGEGTERREIRLGISNHEFAEVRSGIAEGETIIVKSRRPRGRAGVRQPSATIGAAPGRRDQGQPSELGGQPAPPSTSPDLPASSRRHSGTLPPERSSAGLNASQVSRSAADQGTKPAVGKADLRYAGKSFGEWEHILQIELDPEAQIEALVAIEAFAANGYGDESNAIAVRTFSQTRTQKVRLAALNALSAAGDSAVPALIEALNHDNSNVRRRAAKHLASLGPRAKTAHAALLRGVMAPKHEHDIWDFMQAIRSIGEHNPEARRQLLHFIRSRRSESLQRSAWTTLLTLDRSRQVSEALSRALQNDDEAAAAGLFSAGDHPFAAANFAEALAKRKESAASSPFVLQVIGYLLTPELRPYAADYLDDIAAALQGVIAAGGGKASAIQRSILGLGDLGTPALPALQKLAEVVQQRPLADYIQREINRIERMAATQGAHERS